ncbi:YugN family protein [Paenibacillus daejeonensis]|uniref:YugN family protein n=1 Tax=Paenibacillus daejeonensis TaxID=135193 RepID=UPI00035F07D1|nr:YugN family protein [Paenibacillus daejeonensis]
MIRLPSRLESTEHEYIELLQLLEPHEFALGGAWDYKHGSLDRYLDGAHKVWLRLPFDVVSGDLDVESAQNVRIRMGQPYVLKHVYNEGLDQEARVNIVGALFDQFSQPIDSDAEIEPEWVEAGKKLLAQVERLIAR